MTNNQPPKDSFDMDFDQNLFDELEKLGQDPKSTEWHNPDDFNLNVDGEMDLGNALNASQPPIASTNNTTHSNPDAAVNHTGSVGNTTSVADTPVQPNTNAVVPPIAPTKPAGKAVKPKKTNANDPKKLNIMILGAVVLLLILVGAWFLMRGESETPMPPEPAPTSTQIVPATPAELPTPEPSSEPAVSETLTVVEGLDIPVVNPDEILQAEIPSDPALIKEEIDRLTDQDQRLMSQVKDIETYLGDLQKLNDAKEEKITLLEAQITQLEAQKANK